ncbi:hypothetical protein CTEN210_14783 [Chaetoceros tenuissimus]|uniref:Uncharacterized protein n=2 Tax=Chaetoceros tenuissimus TaxID=426638 RepID=A0AAD3HCL6_9STRA|nr:hypothetical protein CTEN210_14783 [Chaetoceros tenuissimus]
MKFGFTPTTIAVLFHTHQHDLNTNNGTLGKFDAWFSGNVHVMIDKFLQRIPEKMNYNITAQGSSTLRNLTDTEYQIIEKFNNADEQINASKILVPLLILLNGEISAMDKCHEMILGVNTTNIIDAEFAATHPPTSWSKDHPLDSDQDILHAFLHRIEGNFVGEGGYRGYENAMYWLAGGSKKLDSYTSHFIWDELKRYIENDNRFGGLNLIAEDVRNYEIISGSGKTRVISVLKNNFDAFRYFMLCEKRYGDESAEDSSSQLILTENEKDLIDDLQRKEIEIMLNIL